MRRAPALAMAALAAAAAGTAWWTTAARPPVGAEAPIATYQCPMHPNVVADRPGQCPVCGMALARVEPAAAPTGAAAPGRAAFALSPDRVQEIGIASAAVEYRELHREIRTAGKVAFDPELYGALSDYRDLLDGDAAPDARRDPEARERIDRARRALTVRLGALGLSLAQLDDVVRAGAEPVSLLLPGASAWIYADVWDVAPDAPRPGQPVRVTAPSLPGRTFRGRIVTVETLALPAARGARVRALVATPGGGVRAETIVRLVVEVPLGRRLAVPEDAVLDTGERRIAFVHHADGRFEPRDVVLGSHAEGYDEVLAGLAPGERVVTGATFLVDSESRFRAALAAFGTPAAATPP